MLTLKNSRPGNPLLLHEEPIYLNDNIIGKTTSGNYSFNYNKSGITIEHDGVRLVKELQTSFKRNDDDNASRSSYRIIMSGSYEYILAPSYKIVELRPDSPAKSAGLLLGDVILYINGKHAHQYSLQEIMNLFYDDTGKNIKLWV